MSAEATAPQKVCKVCQSDIAQLPRVKDAHGRYYCKPCYAAASKKQPAAATSKPMPNPKAAAPKAAPPAKPVRKPATSAVREVPAASLDDFMDDFDTTAEVVQAPVPGQAQPGRCQSCQAPLVPGAVICVSCGANTKTGKKLKGASASSSSGAAAAMATQAAAALGNYAKGVIFGAIGAAIGAAIWSAIAVKTGYQIGYVAWALGGLAGFGMQFGYGDANPKAGFTAVGLALLGITAAKIAFVYFVLQGQVAVGELISLEVIKLTMGPKDFLFIALAVFTAYRVGTHGLSFDGD